MKADFKWSFLTWQRFSAIVSFFPKVWGFLMSINVTRVQRMRSTIIFHNQFAWPAVVCIAINFAFFASQREALKLGVHIWES